MNSSILRAIHSFNGKHLDELSSSVALITNKDIDELIGLSRSGNPSTQTATTWLIKAWSESDNQLSDAHLKSWSSVAKGYDYWEAILHYVQLIAISPVPESDAETTYELLNSLTQHENKMVRAWSLYGLAHVSCAHGIHRDETTAKLINTIEHESGAILVRARKGLELLEN